MKTKIIVTTGAIFMCAMMLVALFYSRPAIKSAKADNKSKNSGYSVKVKTIYEKCGHVEYSNEVLSQPVNTSEVIKKVNNYCSHHYLIKALNNKIAVYKLADLNSDPIDLINANVNLLPDGSRIMLLKGVEANSDEELEAILQDFAD